MATTSMQHLQARAIELAEKLGHVFYTSDKNFIRWAVNTTFRKNLVVDYDEAIGLRAFVLHNRGSSRWSFGQLDDRGGVHDFGPAVSRGALYDALDMMNDVLFRHRPAR